jgi:hypothetical protein
MSKGTPNSYPKGYLGISSTSNTKMDEARHSGSTVLSASTNAMQKFYSNR